MGSPRIRVLASAFATVPGVTAHSAAMMSLVTGVRCELDLVTVKTHDLPHVKRIGEARMFRVPVGNGTHAERRSAFTRAVHRQIEAESYASIHALDAWSGAAAAALKDELGLRMTYEMVAAPEDGPSEEWDEAHERALAAAETLIVPTQAAAARMSESGFAGTVTVVPPGVDVDRFDFVERPPLMIPRVLYIGTFTAERDLDTVLAAIQRVASYRPLRALFAGEPLAARRQRLRARVSELGLADKVEVRGALPARSLPHLIGAADICICPSDGQGITLPQPLVEYLACCRAVIAANCLGLSEVVKDEQQALLYPVGEAGALADAILELLRDSVLRERLTHAGYERARHDLTLGARRRRIAQIYADSFPGSQSFDPWAESFDDVTGQTDLSAADGAADPEAGEGDRPTAATDGVDTAENEAPDARREVTTEPKAKLMAPDTAVTHADSISRDT